MFEYHRASGKHSGGTKFYTVHHIIRTDQTSVGSLIIWQFGGIGAFGQIKTTLAAPGFGRKLYDQKVIERRKSGYQMEHQPVASFASLDTMIRALPFGLPQKLSRADMEHIAPDFDLSNWRGGSGDSSNEQAQSELRAKMEAQLREEERLANEEAARNNPMWGMF